MYCLVKIPHPTGSGNNEYLVDAASLFDAVRRALEINEGMFGRGRQAVGLLGLRRAQRDEAEMEGEGGQGSRIGITRASALAEGVHHQVRSTQQIGRKMVYLVN